MTSCPAAIALLGLVAIGVVLWLLFHPPRHHHGDYDAWQRRSEYEEERKRLGL